MGTRCNRVNEARRGRYEMKMATHWLRLAVCLVVLSASQVGCAFSPAGAPRVPAEERASYDAAMGNLPGNSVAATRSLEAFISRYPRSQLADDASEQLAQIAFARGEQEQGMSWLEQILSRYSTSDRAAAARLRLAQIEYSRDRREAARRLIDPLELRKLDASERRAALRLRVALAQTPVERLQQLSLLRAQLSAEIEDRKVDALARDRLGIRRAAVDRELETLISSSASAELEDTLDGLGRRSPAGAILLELSRRALDAGQLELASQRIERAESIVRGDLAEGELRLLNERLVFALASAEAEVDLPSLRDLANRPRPRTAGARGTIGVVLPLSGKFASFGQESLRGVLLAAGLFGEDATDVSRRDYPDEGFTSRDRMRRAGEPGVRILVRDSESDPVKAADAIRELAENPSLLAVVGPIFSTESLAAAEAAERVGVPLVTLSTREDVAAGRTQAFRTRTTPSDEVDVLVAHAFQKLGALRFAVLYPETRYGRGMRKLYWDAVTARGGKVVAASSYDPDSTDFSTAIRDMVGFRFLSSGERRAVADRSDILRAARSLESHDAARLRKALYTLVGPEGRPLPPVVDFDVLFIPDAAEKIVLIAPGLAFHEISGVKLLGSSEWLDDELLTVARRHVSGSVISAPFYASIELPVVAEFVQGYENTFGETPSAYAAQAFDATNLILVQLASGRSDREGVREGLLDVRAYPGATGVLTMRPDGNARRRPFLLEISGRRFRSLD